MAVNGRLSTSSLRRIYHPRYAVYLEANAARAWEDMRQESLRRFGINLYPLGTASAYRTYSQQVYFRNYWCSRGRCGNAAVPGTSNHGWGRAVDLADGGGRMRWAIMQIGHKYGWYWGEVRHELWHVTYRGGAYRSKKTGPSTKDIQRRLRVWMPGYGVQMDGERGPKTRRAIRDFQKIHELSVDGKVGPRTWAALKRRQPLTTDERRLRNEWVLLRKAKRNEARRKEIREWFVRRRKEIWRAAEKTGWGKFNRRERYEKITSWTK